MTANPYEEGYAACMRSKPWLPALQRTERPKCPYDKASIKHNRWWSGWHSAGRDHADAQKLARQDESSSSASATPELIDGYTQLALFGG